MMAGLLDMMDDPRTMGLLSLGLGLMNSRGNFGQALGQAGPQALAAMQQVRTQQDERKRMQQADALRALQMQQAQMALAQAQRAQKDDDAMRALAQQFVRNPQQMALAGGGGPTVTNAQAAATAAPGFDYQGYANALAGLDPMKALQLRTALQKDAPKRTVVAPGASLVDDATGKPVFTAPEKQSLNDLIVMGPDGKPTLNTMLVDAKRQIAQAGAARTNVTVPINTAKPLLEYVAGGLGKNIDASLDAAQASIPAIQTAQTLMRAVDSGKLIAGPGSTFRVLGLQIGQMLGVAGKDGTETLTNTRAAIQSLARAELAAAAQMRGQGQITESERGILKRAESGEIDNMTVPELRQLAQVMEKTARTKIRLHQANVQRLSAMPDAAPIIPFYQIEEPPAYSPSAPKRYNPATGRIE